MPNNTLSAAEAAYLAELKIVVDAADAADAPVKAQIAKLQGQLSDAKDPTVATARRHYRNLSPRLVPPHVGATKSK